MRRLATGIVVFALTSTAWAAATGDPLSGVWVLNPSRTYYGGGAERRKSETLQCKDRNDRVECVITSVRDDGRAVTGRFTAAYDGKRYRSSGIPDVDQVAITRVNESIADATFSFKGRPVFGYRIVQSANRKSLTVISVDPETRRVLNSVVTYDRRDNEPPASMKAPSAFSAASGITRATGASRPHRIVPLRPMTGDVEILSGDPEKAGEPFVMRIRELPGTMVPLHSHPVDENITVLTGTWYFAVGDKWDRTALKPLHAGDYAFAAKGSTMFAYCPDGAVVQVHGIGPFTIHWKHGAKTLDDPDASTTFKFRRGERVRDSRGQGIIRQGYASGDIVQYEIEKANGERFMGNQSELHR